MIFSVAWIVSICVVLPRGESATDSIESVFITPSGTNTAGETYRLMCSVTVMGSTNQPTITWLDDGVQITPDSSRTVSATTGDSSNGYSSTLTFSPLSARSHAGTYTCRATIAALNLTDEDTFTVQVNVPGISAMTF